MVRYITKLPQENSQAYKNDEIRTAIQKNCYLDGYSDKVPSEINKEVQLVVDVTPKNNKIINIVKVVDPNDPPGTFTLDTDKDFYVTNIYVASNHSILGGANADIIKGVINGITTKLAEGVCLDQANGVTNSQVSLTFTTPIKLDRGSVVTFAIINDSSVIGFYGYYIDTMIYDTGLKQ